MDTPKKVVIVGGGFGGLNVARFLARANLDVVVIDKTNYHLFQPLLYQVAMAALSPADITATLRSIFKRQKNVRVILGEVTAVDKDRKEVHLANHLTVPFDYLVLAPGGVNSYFGQEHWKKYAPSLKTVADALSIRENLLYCFEKAEVTADENKRSKYLTFVIIGGGPTGVELAGAVAEIAKKTMLGDFRSISPEKARVVLVEAMDRLLPSYPLELSQRAEQDLRDLGVEVRLRSPVAELSSRGVRIGEEWLETSIVVCAAGSMAPAFLRSLNVSCEEKTGRVKVQGDLTIPGYPDIFVIGDAACALDERGRALPAIAPVAVQQGRHVAQILRRAVPSQQRTAFVYRDRGMIVTIGRARAVALLYGKKFAGFFAWMLWVVVHVSFLVGFRNKLLVMLNWCWYYIAYQPVARLITDRVDPSLAEQGEETGEKIAD